MNSRLKEKQKKENRKKGSQFDRNVSSSEGGATGPPSVENVREFWRVFYEFGRV
jgi:hypothetical protein